MTSPRVLASQVRSYPNQLRSPRRPTSAANQTQLPARHSPRSGFRFFPCPRAYRTFIVLEETISSGIDILSFGCTSCLGGVSPRSIPPRSRSDHVESQCLCQLRRPPEREEPKDSSVGCIEEHPLDEWIPLRIDRYYRPGKKFPTIDSSAKPIECCDARHSVRAFDGFC